MTDKDELPVVSDVANTAKRIIWQNKEVQIIEVGDIAGEGLPEYFHINDYVIMFITQGALYGQFNLRDVDLAAPSAVYLFNDQVLHYKDSTPDLKVRVLAYSPAIADELALPIPGDMMQYAYVRPAVPLADEDMNTVMQYLDLLEEIMRRDDKDRHSTILHLMRSLMTFSLGSYVRSVPLQKPLSRAEDIAGKFMSLVDMHCAEHHSIDWYASEMCLSPKYIANVVKEVTGRTAGDCITECIIRQAKSMLMTSKLQIQQISDRLGFRNQSHFGTFFRRATGLSPRAFKR